MRGLPWVPIGSMRKRIVIESPTDTSDGSGGSVTSWTLLMGAWAAVEPLSGRERMQAMAVQSDVSHTVTMRYRSGITSKCRVLLGVRVFRVIVPRDIDELHRQLVLDCAEVAGDAGT